ncbi:MAG: tryptophan--tRNA ligase [Candidatus Eremiobacteraeota bacterium]|nr:tryptophan--tRNA ligase [Candidatus Eremiobacteraeota bacterium]
MQSSGRARWCAKRSRTRSIGTVNGFGPGEHEPVPVKTVARTRVMSGMRPTGRLHLGHLVGALTNWAELSKSTDAYFAIVDLHALTTAYDRPAEIREMREEMVRDWLAAGVDPTTSTIYLQSAIPETSELHVLLSMITPVSWLERTPTYKEQIEALGGDVATYGFLGYPLLQLCDIATFRAEKVPVGRDQVAHLELGREIVRRFNRIYGETLVEPQPLLTEFAAVPGTDGRKMSKSYANTIEIADDEETTTKKVRSMFTDPQKLRCNDPGRPEICPVYDLHEIVNQLRTPWIEENCRSGALGCVQCKAELAEKLNAYLGPIRERRRTFDLGTIAGIIREGTARARVFAAQTLADVKRAMRLTL